MDTRPERQVGFARWAWWIAGAAVALQLVLIAVLGDRTYVDVQRAVHFGWDIADGRLSVTTHMDRSKTFLGPLAWYLIYQQWGVYALKALNLALFAGLLAAHRRIGGLVATPRVATIAFALLAFYPGSLRSVSASEVDDNVSHLMVGLGILAMVSGRGAIWAGLLMGVGFLFKYWVAMLAAGFAIGIASRRSPTRWRDAVAFSLAAALPFVVYNLATDFVGFRSIFLHVQRHTGFSDAGTIAFKLFSTGMLPIVAVAGYACWRNPTDDRRLLFSIVPVYFAYVLGMRDAFAVTFVMVACLVPLSFLVAEVVDEWLPRHWIGAFAVAAAAVGFAIAFVNLERDTRPFRMDRERFPPRPVPAWSFGDTVAPDPETR